MVSLRYDSPFDAEPLDRFTKFAPESLYNSHVQQLSTFCACPFFGTNIEMNMRAAFGWPFSFGGALRGGVMACAER